MMEREQTITLQTHLFTHPHTHTNENTGDCIYTHAHFSRGMCCIPVLLPVRFILKACSSQWNNLLQAVGLNSSEKKKKKGALSPDEGKTEIPLGCRRLRRVLNSSLGRRSDANLPGQSQQDCATTTKFDQQMLWQ